MYLHLPTDLSISSLVRSLVSQGRMYLLISRKVITWRKSQVGSLTKNDGLYKVILQYQGLKL